MRSLKIWLKAPETYNQKHIMMAAHFGAVISSISTGVI